MRTRLSDYQCLILRDAIKGGFPAEAVSTRTLDVLQRNGYVRVRSKTPPGTYSGLDARSVSDGPVLEVTDEGRAALLDALK